METTCFIVFIVFRHITFLSKSNLRSGVPYIFCRWGKVPFRRDKKYKGRLIAG